MRADEARARLARAAGPDGPASSDFDLNPARPPATGDLREAGVLVAALDMGGAAHLLLTKRASHLSQHPGQIAFPGGRRDPGDADAVDTALREATEEVALPRTSVEVLGMLPVHETVTGYRMTPVVGWITGPFAPRPEPGEVAEIFTVPAAHVLDPARFRVESRLWRGQLRRYYTVPWGPYYVWGATARILRGLAARVA